MALGNLLADGLELLLLGHVDDVGVVLTHHLHVRRDHRDVEVVDLLELLLFRRRGTGHTGQLVVHAEVVLQGDRGQGLVLRLDLDLFFGLDGLVQAVRPPPAGHQAAGELVDDNDLAVLDDVLVISLEERVRPQALVDCVQQIRLVGVVEVLDAEQAFCGHHALVRQRGVMGLLVHQVVSCDLFVAVLVLDFLAPLELRDDGVDPVVEVDGDLRRAGDDERRSCLVDEDRVDLVDDGVDVVPLHHTIELKLHVVAQVVEAELVVGSVGDVATVGVLALIVLDVVLDAADREAEEGVKLSHPFRVTRGEIVVDGHHVYPAARQGIEHDGESGDKGLAFSSPHLRDPAFVQHDAPVELYVEVTHAQGSPPGFASQREDLVQFVVEDLLHEARTLDPVLGKIDSRRLNALTDDLHALADILVTEPFDIGLEGVDCSDARAHTLHITLRLRAEDEVDSLFDDVHGLSPGC